MRKFVKGLFLLIFILPACSETEFELPVPSPDYPFTYSELSQEEMATNVELFNTINTEESLKLNDYGILRGHLPVDLSNGIDSLNTKNSISFILNNYAPFLGISNPENISIEREATIRMIGGVDTPLSYYFRSGETAYPVFSIEQPDLYGRQVMQTEISFYFSEKDNQMVVFGRWYPEAFCPEVVVVDKEAALRAAVYYINENHAEVTPLDLSNVEPEKFNKVFYPLPTENGIEMRECWKINIWSNFVQTLVDTQTGEIIYYLNYRHMI